MSTPDSNNAQAPRSGRTEGSRLRRAGRACLGCRARKVRCDVVQKEPCSNCELDRVQCVVPRTRRSRKILLDAHSPNKPSRVSNSIYVDTRTERVSVSPRSKVVEDVPSSPDQSQLPGFIKAPVDDDPVLLQFLTAKGAFSLPGLEMQYALIKAFVDIAHPRMPCMDIASFLAAVQSQDGSSGQVSLLLYHAILFCGAAHVTVDVLMPNGFSNNRSLRRALYRRAEILIELTSEPDQLVLIQACLLLSFRGVSRAPEDRKDTWHWMNSAVTLAFANGLHQSSSYATADASKVWLMRRLWWCCYVRDKIQAIGLSRPSRIKDSDHDVPMLQYSDLDAGTLLGTHVVFGVDTVGAYSSEKLADSIDLYIEKTKLSLLISKVIDNRVGTDQAGNLLRIAEVSLDLDRWRQELPESCRPRPRALIEPTDNATMAVITRRYLLSMAFYMAVIMLHRPVFLPAGGREQSFTAITTLDRETSKAAATDAANSLTQLAAELHHNKMDHNLPVSTIMMICPAIFMHLLGMRSSNHDTRESAMFSFRVCMRLMESLRGVYSVTDATIDYLETALRNASSGPTVYPSISSILQLNKHDYSDITAVLGLKQSTPPAQPVKITSHDAGFGGLESALASAGTEAFQPEEYSYEDFSAIMDMGTLCQEIGGNSMGVFTSPVIHLGMDGRSSLNGSMDWTMPHEQEALLHATGSSGPVQDTRNAVANHSLGMDAAWT